MKVDSYGCVVMEHSSEDGNRGDSCAETARLWHLCWLLKTAMPGDLKLAAFRTDKFYLRHPLSIWPEEDTSTDQILPLWLCYCLANPILAKEMLERLKKNKWRLYGGQFISPGFYALLKNNQWLINMTLAAQALFFKFPYRWSDEKKQFERSEGSSADYLNWIHAAVYAPLWVRTLIDADTLHAKVVHYYRVEPNAFVVPLYKDLIDIYFRRPSAK